eukprot:MONOS_2403.1-p1 / transcript=MONOS_2403.1 / gene=MONOS_2403 / organism=Monocercomonoides_exilis_PA203 / gene_product=unspecified product / transcript_product=unspecified product / location=Mono_scaffold00049:116693-116920(+) / protein_length=76 / sequence_SO=supercontig / SO=protein_coding / is_pseudo=false
MGALEEAPGAAEITEMEEMEEMEEVEEKEETSIRQSIREEKDKEIGNELLVRATENKSRERDKKRMKREIATVFK